jgi:hypothetical protein
MVLDFLPCMVALLGTADTKSFTRPLEADILTPTPSVPISIHPYEEFAQTLLGAQNLLQILRFVLSHTRPINAVKRFIPYPEVVRWCMRMQPC